MAEPDEAPRFRLPGGGSLRLLEEADAEELYRLVERNRASLAEWMPWAAGLGPSDVGTRLSRPPPPAPGRSQRDRGWTPAEYEQWFADTASAQLLRDASDAGYSESSTGRK